MKEGYLKFILRSTAITGLLGSGFILFGSLITGIFYVGRSNESYSLLNHYVSELGEIGVSNLPFIFNIGLILGAIFLCIFLMGIAWLMQSWLGWGFAVLALITGVSGLLVGVYPMNLLPQHLSVALTFFNVGQLTMLFFSVFVLFNKSPWFTKKLAIPGFITVGFFIVFLNMPSSFQGDNDFELAMYEQLNNRPDVIPLAIFEWLIILGLLSWVILTSVHLWRFYKKEFFLEKSTA